MVESPFRLLPRAARSTRQPLKSLASSALEHALSLHHLDGVYRAVPRGLAPIEFCRSVLEVMGVRPKIEPRDLESIPREGPVIVVANHPFGGLEGVLLGAVLGELRPDVRLMANYLVARIPELAPIVCAVDPFGGDTALRRNIAPMRAAVEWLREGGLLVVFPAGAVSHLDLRRREVSDPPWQANLATLVRRSSARVVPTYIEGRNSNTFQLAGLLHPRLRTALLPQQMMRVAGETVPIRFGQSISNERLTAFEDKTQLVDHLRMRTYLLAHREGKPTGEESLARSKAARQAKPRTPALRLPRAARSEQPIAEAEDPLTLEREFDAMWPERHSLTQGQLSAFRFRAHEAPSVVREVGRLREVTFRAVGEGTGLPRDLDKFDASYEHLVIWNRAKREVVGSYRLASTCDVVRPAGEAGRLGGLYTSTLFHLEPALLDTTGPALEVGRSFVRAEYQRSYAPLLMLWKGIGRFLVARPEHRHVFGALSISAEYQHVSRSLMARYLYEQRADGELCRFVRPRHSFRAFELPGRRSGANEPTVGGLEQLCESVREVEGDLGVPVLLREYVKLGARVLGMSVDPAFGNTLDALVLVDLEATPRRLLNRYLGPDGAASFLAARAARVRSGPEDRVAG